MHVTETITEREREMLTVEQEPQREVGCRLWCNLPGGKQLVYLTCCGSSCQQCVLRLESSFCI